MKKKVRLSDILAPEVCNALDIIVYQQLKLDYLQYIPEEHIPEIKKLVPFSYEMANSNIRLAVEIIDWYITKYPNSAISRQLSAVYNLEDLYWKNKLAFSLT